MYKDNKHTELKNQLYRAYKKMDRLNLMWAVISAITFVIGFTVGIQV